MSWRTTRKQYGEGMFHPGAGIGKGNIEQVISVAGQPASYRKHRDSGFHGAMG